MRDYPFTDAEKRILGLLAEPHIEILEDASQDADCISKKEQTWGQIAKEFNENSNTQHKRHSEHFRRCWEHLRSRFKVHLHDTGKSQLILHPSFPTEFAAWVAEFGKSDSENETMHSPVEENSVTVKKRKKTNLKHCKGKKKKNESESDKEAIVLNGIKKECDERKPSPKIKGKTGNKERVNEADDEKISSRLVSRPFTKEERLKIVHLISTRKTIINSRRSNNFDMKLKNKTWAEITEEYNKTVEYKRDVRHVRKFWDNMKVRIRRLLVLEGFSCFNRLQLYEIEALRIMDPKVFSNLVDERELLKALNNVGIHMDPGTLEDGLMTSFTSDDDQEPCPMPVETVLEEANPLQIDTVNGLSIEEQMATEHFLGEDHEYENVPVSQEVVSEFQAAAPDLLTIKDEPLSENEDDTEIAADNSTSAPTIPSLFPESRNSFEPNNNIDHSMQSSFTPFVQPTKINSFQNPVSIHIPHKGTAASTNPGPIFLVMKPNEMQVPDPKFCSMETEKAYCDYIRRKLLLKEEKHLNDLKRLKLEESHMQEKHETEMQILRHKLELTISQMAYWRKKKRET